VKRSQFGDLQNDQHATCEKEKHQTILLAMAITASGAPQELLFLLKCTDAFTSS